MGPADSAPALPEPIPSEGPCDWEACPKWAAIIVAREVDGVREQMRVCLTHDYSAHCQGWTRVEPQ